MDRLKDKRALITNGTSGIGLATARRFIDEGARTHVTGTVADAVEKLRRELGPHGCAWCLDASIAADQQRLAERVADDCGGLDVLFVNLAAVRLAPLNTWDEAAFDHEIAANVRGPFFLLRTLLPLLRRPSSVVINTTFGGHTGMPYASVFAAGRAALMALARSLAVELIGQGIRINMLSPGLVAMPAAPNDRAHDAARASIAAQVPARRLGEPLEIADAVVYLACDESMYAVGTELVVDGGLAAA
ncbi:SDR family oxidoreductase [Caldimonas sp. KR1-144]|uniref:SDR family oxidoreductase n=1 Tax=Caldimonas sp. KR1-144 TaxID=3400911 RepID=UPI003BFBCE9D